MERPKATASRDPLIDDVRAVRAAIEREHGPDVRSLARYVRSVGTAYRRKRARRSAASARNDK